MTSEEVTKLLVDLHGSIRQIADIIGTPEGLRPAINREAGARYWVTIDWHVEDDGDDVSEYRYYLWTREHGIDWELGEAGLEYRDVFLYNVFRTITHQMAMSQLGNPKIGEIDRQQLFQVQEDLLREYDPAWAERLALDHDRVLRA
jgi:hypothetical protein